MPQLQRKIYMNQDLKRLHPYPFERLRRLLAGEVGPAVLRAINLSIGEPKHPTPQFIKNALLDNVNGLASYPTTAGLPQLRQTIAHWLGTRYGLLNIDFQTQLLPVTGSREALFSFAQVVLDRAKGGYVLCPNPFYQIYEGAALLGGAQPYFVNGIQTLDGTIDYTALPVEVLLKTQLIYVCSPDNPTGRVMTLAEWRILFDLSAKYGFVIAADECYSEIYFRDSKPLGAFQAAIACGNDKFERLMVFSSLSKRSNVPGMRSGFVAGDSALIKAFLLYRTYHGSAMSPTIQAASVAAWSDEAHVEENRALYREKFARVTPLIQQVLETALPDAGFYLWARIPENSGVTDDIAYAKNLFAATGVTVLPGSFLARETEQGNPGKNHIRIALVDTVDLCVEAAHRIVEFSSPYLS